MILYLCSNQNINLFDFLDKDLGMPIKKMSGFFKLKQFVIHDVRNLSQFNFFVIDVKALKDSETEIIEAITAFGSMYSARIILFAEGLDGSSSLLSRLIDIGIYNIIISTDFKDIKEDMIQCVTPEGKDIRSAIRSKYFTPDEIKEKGNPKYTFLCSDIKIAVIGAVHKVGTTTTAFNLVNYLASSGAEAAYVEANMNEHLKWLPDYYKDMAVNETFIEHKSVKYYFNGNFPVENNFIVIDFGTVAQCRIQALKQCETIILCGTTKPHEIGFVKRALKELEGLPLYIILSHTPRSAQEHITEFLGYESGRICFSEYSPEFFDGKANEMIFRKIINDYIQETY